MPLQAYNIYIIFQVNTYYILNFSQIKICFHKL